MRLRLGRRGGAQGADDAMPQVLAADFDGVEAVLAVQQVGSLRTAQRDAKDSPVAALRLDGVLGEHRLVGAVEGAGAKMQDADAKPRRIVARRAHRRRNLRQRGQGQPPAHSR